MEELEFWKKAVAEPDLRKVIDQGMYITGTFCIAVLRNMRPCLTELKAIISGPATTQSFKGLLTAGLRKSVIYAAAKVGKWWKSKAKKA